MVIAICLSLNLLLLIFTIVLGLKLHLFEVIFIWIVVTFLHQMIYYLITQNFHFWTTPLQLDLFWGLVITRMVSIPIMFLWLIEFSKRSSSFLAKSVLLILFISLMAGIDYVMNAAGIVRFVTWCIWLSYAEWLFISIICLLLTKGYCNILRREEFI